MHHLLVNIKLLGPLSAAQYYHLSVNIKWLWPVSLAPYYILVFSLIWLLIVSSCDTLPQGLQLIDIYKPFISQFHIDQKHLCLIAVLL
jgi:TRAP-type C4-dicarboxylate transport system permease large subunit